MENPLKEARYLLISKTKTSIISQAILDSLINKSKLQPEDVILEIEIKSVSQIK